ncbi:MAG: SUMF1/EgtB/PvdO family nonheme iron enzyme [Akkermansiaceae bacterium]|nr:SUMF1/EgtB/PvdO family nonheme iron enzyme [Akkermansiaceae bacterium]
MSSDLKPLFSTGREVGDYLLGPLIYKGASTSTWEATQMSVQRQVLVCNLDDAFITDHETRQEFIADVKVKASVDHPLVASILEAVNEGNVCYFAYEKVKGRDLAELHKHGETITPLEIARILCNISSAYEHIESRKIATLNLSPHDIYVDQDHHCRISNLAVSGHASHSRPKEDKELLGHLLQDMIEPNEPGSTRTNTLLGSMALLNNAQPKSWRQIHDLSDEIERQLTRQSESVKLSTSSIPIYSTKRHYLHISTFTGKILAVSTALLVIAGLGFYLSATKAKPQKRVLADMVNIAAGKYSDPYGFHHKVRGFWLDAHEVTIGEYAEFIKAVESLPLDMQDVYQHEDQPDYKTSHIPDDWDEIYTAAKEGGTWNDHKIGLYHPVVGVDWWDAHAYAEWKGRSLIRYRDWYAACSSSCEPSKLQGTGYAAVDKAEQTTTGIFGMAGNVSEWMREPILDPADPSAPPRYMVGGASYMRPKYGARAREWVDSRDLRRFDIGFRTCNNSRQ